MIVGTPGAYARTLERQASAKSFPLIASSLASAAAAAYLFFQQGNAPAAALAGIFAVACRVRAERFLTDKRKASIGRRNEELVAKKINKCGASMVAHGQVIGYGGDCDHIVAGSCLVAIETKTGAGNVSYSNGQLTAGRRVIPGDPIAQVARQRKNLTKVTSKPAVAAVVVPGMTNEPFVTADNVHVMSIDYLRSFLASCPKVLDMGDIRRLEKKFSEPS